MSIPNTNKPQTIFPDLPRNQPFLNNDGTMNHYWMLWFENLNMALQVNLKNEGFVIPSQPTTNIVLLTGVQSIANILYDSSTGKFKGNESGTWRTFVTV